MRTVSGEIIGNLADAFTLIEIFPGILIESG